ncbi:MAG: cytochrome C biogenesis protein [Bradyrhizobiaceae bacterium]|nr:MAG: cytochrome C biogenesis protein [Bradyrhizobiaceae bacterium]
MFDIVPWLVQRMRLIAALFFCIIASAANAQDVSAWAADKYSAVRLLAGSRNGAVLLGGIGFKLDPGWKTYWRSPGDSGVPPRFDFSKSENVEAVNVLWPAPKKFPDGNGGFSLGYHDQVVVPLRIVTKNADQPVTLRAHIDYAVCDKLCIPVDADLELPFVSVASMQDSVLSSALESVPKPASIGDPNPLTIRDVKRIGPKTVQVNVVAPEGVEAALFVEGPTPDWALPIPKLAKREPHNVQRFTFDLDGVPPGVSPNGAALKFTLSGGNRTYEFNTNLN